MSLKAKLEAVIYAAEEPVTLAQLATLFTADALAWKAEQQAASTEVEEAQAETIPLPMDAVADQAGLETQPQAVPAEDSAQEAAPPTSSEQETVPEPAEEALADPESEFKRQARLRDREVRTILRQLLDEIIASCATDDRGIEIREIAGGYRMATKPECHDAVRVFIKSLKPALKLSLPALETLAVIAYKQPVTAPEVNEIRGVESGGVLGSLLSRKLIATAGRKQVIGRPILYKTTKEFLLRFGLKDLAELPSMEEFEKMAAIELEGLEEPESENGEYAVAPEGEPNQAGNLELEEDGGEDSPTQPIKESDAAVAETPATQAAEDHAEDTEAISPSEAEEASVTVAIRTEASAQAQTETASKAEISENQGE